MFVLATSGMHVASSAGVLRERAFELGRQFLLLGVQHGEARFELAHRVRGGGAARAVPFLDGLLRRSEARLVLPVGQLKRLDVVVLFECARVRQDRGGSLAAAQNNDTTSEKKRLIPVGERREARARDRAYSRDVGTHLPVHVCYAYGSCPVTCAREDVLVRG